MAMPSALDASQRDKPLSFNWKAMDTTWLEPLDLPTAPSKKYKEVRSAILLDAMAAHSMSGCAMPETEAVCTGWVSYSRNRNWWAGTSRYFPYSHASVIRAVENSAMLGWLAHVIAPTNPSCGWQSRFRASPLLLEAADLPEISRSIRELIILKDGEKQLSGYRDTIQTERWRNQTEAQNEAINSVDINITHPDAVIDGNVIRIGNHILYPSMNALYRVFNKDWKHGGRFYGGWWQNAKNDNRRFMTINDEDTVEEDYSQLHPRLLYRMEGQPLDVDAYTIDGWERDLCKKALNIILNAGTYQSALVAIASKIGARDGPGNNYEKAKALICALKAKHQPVAKYFHTGVGLRLQAVDASIAENVMRRLRKQGVVSLPVHDSFIVPANDHDALKEAMDIALKMVKLA